MTHLRLPALAMLLAAALGVLLLAPMDATSQFAVAACLLLALYFLGIVARHGDDGVSPARVALLLLGCAISVRYLLWRLLYTLNIDDPLSLAGALLLFAAECYAISSYLFSCFVAVLPLRRPRLDIDSLDAAPRESLPTVDILIPSYDESPALLETTLRAAIQQRYPRDRLRVHLLDDGGTEQRCHAEDFASARSARERRAALQDLCRRLGVTYHTRRANEGAKAGNLNAALAHTDGELVAVLDADHVPTTGFLARTVPWLLRDERVFLVQTPHHMINPDPVERNFFRAFNRIPSESDMFYGTVQRGMDFWGASFFCGSAAVLRRAHLEEVGGIAGRSVTEDAETSLRLHARGYRSVYIDEPLVSGLAPETFEGFIRQRVRWAQGMVQILRLEKPWCKAGLAWHQRLGYMNAIGFWLFPFARIIFLLMPLLFLVFGLQIYKASLADILAFTVPHVIGTFSVAYLLHGRTRWPLVSELYEMLQTVFTLPAVVDALRHPDRPTFGVTPKGQNLDRAAISPLARPFYWLLLIMIIGLVAGIDRLVTQHLARDLTVVVLIWHTFNFLLVLGALATIVERRQLRGVPRIDASDRVVLETAGGHLLVATLNDVSESGCSLDLGAGHGERLPAPLEAAALHALSPGDDASLRVPVSSMGDVSSRGDLRCRFDAQTDAERQAVVRFARGDERRLEALRRRRQRPMSYAASLAMLLRAAGRPLLDHARLLLRRGWTRLLRGKQTYA